MSPKPDEAAQLLCQQDALLPPRAYGAPLGSGRLKVVPEDFQVEEQLGFLPQGSGQHVLLRVRKRDANTAWVARNLARLARCPQSAVGYAGIKDRRAIAVQWFSVPQSPLSVADWTGLQEADFVVLEAHAHHRKLPRGALTGNQFAIRIRDCELAPGPLAQRIAAIQQQGIPNYFGPQRFGRGGANLHELPVRVRELHPARRSYVLSAARSWIFNGVLAQRVRAGSWNQLLSGDLANLDGRGSVFAMEEPDPTLLERLRRLEIHPTGPLWGEGAPPTSGAVRDLEEGIASQLPAACALLTDARMRQERRSLRIAVTNLQGAAEQGTVNVSFGLPRGAYATTVLREIVDLLTETEEAESEGD
ncbi:MAG: tRNA pseudouridine(13) synthase TruD [Sinobacteraceae bacterium]|nr:tRNA pseudouridine(13) synthase TruD [Nevskiaceae bacterium]